MQWKYTFQPQPSCVFMSLTSVQHTELRSPYVSHLINVSIYKWYL